MYTQLYLARKKKAVNRPILSQIRVQSAEAREKKGGGARHCRTWWAIVAGEEPRPLIAGIVAAGKGNHRER
jgi:hypothetical protein